MAVHGRDLNLLKLTLGPPKKFKHLTRAELVVITRLWIGHTRANKSHILSRGPPTACQNCGQTLIIDHMFLRCAVLQGNRDEYYIVNSLNIILETISEICIVECNPLHMKTQKVWGMGDMRPPPPPPSISWVNNGSLNWIQILCLCYHSDGFWVTWILIPLILRGIWCVL